MGHIARIHLATLLAAFCVHCSPGLLEPDDHSRLLGESCRVNAECVIGLECERRRCIDPSTFPVQWGSPALDQAKELVIDDAGDLYVVGVTQGALDGMPANGHNQAFVTKVSSVGNRQWARALGPEHNDLGTGLSLSPTSGDVWICGATNPKDEGEFDAVDAFVSLVSPGGEEREFHPWGSNKFDGAAAVAFNAEGYAYVVGQTWAEMGSGPSLGWEDFFLTRFAPDFTVETTAQGGTAGVDWVWSVTLSADGAVVYAVGHTTGQLEGQSTYGEADVFVAAYAADLSHIYSRQWGTPKIDRAKAVGVLQNGHLVVAGFCNGEGDLDALNLVPYPPESSEAWVAEYDSDGEILWQDRFGDPAAHNEVLGLLVDGDRFYLVGVTGDDLDGVANRGGKDMFLAAYEDRTRVATLMWGSPEDDEANDVVLAANGELVVLATTHGSPLGAANAGSSDLLLMTVDAPP